MFNPVEDEDVRRAATCTLLLVRKAVKEEVGAKACAGRRRSDDGKRQGRKGTSIQNHGGRARWDGYCVKQVGGGIIVQSIWRNRDAGIARSSGQVGRPVD